MTDNCTACGHPSRNHDGPLWPQCSAARCTCLRYRPPAAAPAAPPAAPLARRLSAVEPIPSALATPAVRRNDDHVAPAVPTPTVDELARALLRSENKRTKALAPKLLELAEKCRAALRSEREAAEAKARAAEEAAAAKAKVEKLQKQLAAAKAELRRTKSAAGDDGEVVYCEDCGEKCKNEAGRKIHAARKHPVSA